MLNSFVISTHNLLSYLLYKAGSGLNIIFIHPTAETGTGFFQIAISIVSLIVSSILSYFVIHQAKQQNIINEKVLDADLRANLGYFVPRLSDTYTDGHKTDHRHRLKEGIDLDNIGDDCVFILETELVVCDQKKDLPEEPEMFCTKELPFNSVLFECHLTDEELNQYQIDMEITLVLANTKGYKYKEILFLGFENINGLGKLNKFNMHLEGEKSHAD